MTMAIQGVNGKPFIRGVQIQKFTERLLLNETETRGVVILERNKYRNALDRPMSCSIVVLVDIDDIKGNSKASAGFNIKRQEESITN